ncbi:hypothetical protein B0A50_00278 [Salinomyces thailandicus]|uniref:UBC core domain-containing protein n=1 Tax=Salinomyces thailandicus TaxID=706561 RepID=A0A4U0UFG9_9PEZI|nr:hypothetical protein B0A50_00278 [Salinomyces thailandica]
MDHTLHVDDIVSRTSNKTVSLGVVERTHGDVDTHEPRPNRIEPEPIKHDSQISQAAFRQFKRDGIPPKGTVLVRWEAMQNASLILESTVELLDRSLLIGDVVKRNVRDAMSGVIINTLTKCALQPVYDVRYKENHVIKGLLPPPPTEGGFQPPANLPAPVLDVPSTELTFSSTISEEDLVIYKDWIGRVLTVTERIALLLADGCVVEIDGDLAQQADGAVDAYEIADVVMTKKGHLRTGKWIFGQYNANTPPIGTVVQTRPVMVEVQWLQKRIGCSSELEPTNELEREELESESFKVYDRSRRPSRQANAASGTISNSEIDIRLGSRVRFKDLAGACVKYDGSTPQGKVPRIDRLGTRGYDINVFDVVRFYTEVIVQWQDLSISQERSIDLVPDPSIDDEHAAWPGEIAHTLDIRPVPDMPSVEQPGKVGVVQTVHAGERMAKIRWAPDAVIHYGTDTEEGNGARTLLIGAVGTATGEVSEVSLYDVEAPGAMNVRRGDIVLIANKTWTGSPGAPARDGREWLGEIVDTCLDGTVTVRLGAAGTPQDVNLRREDVVVAVRSDGTEDLDHWGEDEDEEMDDEMADMFGGPEVALDGSGNLGVWHRHNQGWPDDMEEDSEDSWGDEDDEDEVGHATYEDEFGQPMDEDEAENEDWKSDDENEAMPDAEHQQTPPTSTSITPPNISNPTLNRNPQPQPPASEPEQYLILSSDPPRTHHYAHEPPTTNNPTHLKRVQKEHRILQKPGSIPAGIYLRTWETRLDLLRALFIGPTDTPYAHAPFIIDFHLPPNFPTEPPQAFFHSWPGEPGLGGVGRVNPNLYEDGKICLSLLGTWEGAKAEGWNAARCTLLQVLVSLLGLVLVKEPYFNEAGYEHLVGLESSRRPSALYSERTFLRSRTFVLTALARVRDVGLVGGLARDMEGLEGVISWLYWDKAGPGLAEKVVKGLEGVLGASEGAVGEPDGVKVMSRGVCIPLRRVLERLRALL